MSYDLEIWATRTPENLRSVVPDGDRWVARGESLVLDGGSWQIVLGGPEKVEDEDVPDNVRSALPGIRWLYPLNLEPLAAPAAARKSLKSTAKAVAVAAHGAVHDPQEDAVTLPSGIKRYAAPSREKDVRFDVLTLGWWFLGGPLLEPGGYSKFIGLLERFLPDALPRRYGTYEPPQFRFEESGRDHLVTYLAEANSSIVWYPTKPVVSVGLGAYEPPGWQGRLGFRSHRVEIELDSAALNQPGWPDQLVASWKEISAFLKPFYGEVRFLGGCIPSRTTYCSDFYTEESPTKSWWWRGIPRKPGCAVALGDPYASLWPEFTRLAERKGETCLVTLPQWSKGGSIQEITGPVPEGLMQRWTPEMAQASHGGWSMRWNTEYPPVFPFGGRPEGIVE